MGVVVLPGIGSDNIWSYLSLHKNGQPYGGTLTSSIIGKIATLNPCIADSTNEWGILQLIYSPLLYVDPVSGEDTPMLAESWSTEAWTSPNGSDGMKVTFKLRNNVLWQDGVPFTSHDIKVCVDYLKERDVPRYRSICTNIEKVETLDDTTVIIYLNEPGYRLLYALNWFTFMPEHIWKNVPDYTQYKPWSEDKPDTIGLTKLVGQGPFIIKKSDLKGDITLYWNPLYFMTNTDKPGLVKKDTTPTTAIVGEKVTFSYIVSNNTGSPLRAASANFTLSVKRGDQSTALEQKVTYQNEKYVALVDSAKLAPGEYTCIFSAIPFGSTSSQLVILKQTSTATNTTQPTDTTKPTTPSPSGVPGYPIEVITSGILLATLSLIILKKSRTRN